MESCGLNVYVVDNEDGTFAVVRRQYNPCPVRRQYSDDDNDEIEQVGNDFPSLMDALYAAEALVGYLRLGP